MIGRWFTSEQTGAPQRAFVRLLGVPDFHTHLRLAPLENYRVAAGSRLCELGCGEGVGVIELLLRNPETSASAHETDTAALERGERLARHCGLEGRLAFRRGDLARVVPNEMSSADCVLLLDVLEHLPDPTRTAAAIAASLKPGARLLISVPTPLYPRLFGRRYHALVGHLWDGFEVQQLDRLFAGLERLRVRYSVGPMSWPGVLLCYRLPWQPLAGQRATGLRRAIGAIVTALSIPFRMIDLWNSSKVSCSLFIEYVKAPPAASGAAGGGHAGTTA